MIKREELFFNIMDNHKGVIVKICSAYSTTTHDFEDLFQEVVLNIWKSIDSFKGNSLISTWVYKVALNVCFTIKNKKIKKQSIENFQFNNINYVDDVIKEIEKSEDIAALYECIKKLKEVDRSLIILYLEDVPYKEIGNIIGISENYVAIKMKRIKSQLEKCLKNKL